jgi:hypothetical protein
MTMKTKIRSFRNVRPCNRIEGCVSRRHINSNIKVEIKIPLKFVITNISNLRKGNRDWVEDFLSKLSIGAFGFVKRATSTICVIWNLFIAMLQRGRGVRGHHYDKGCASFQRQSCLDSASDLQVILWDRRQVLPVRPTDVLHEVRIMDIWWLSGKIFLAVVFKNTNFYDSEVKSDKFRLSIKLKVQPGLSYSLMKFYYITGTWCIMKWL